MKKFITVALAIAMLIPLCMIGVGAAETAPLNHVRPDWLITEIICNTMGDATLEYGYIDNKDPFEAIEIYNNSGKTLSLYDYCLTYNGSGLTSEEFQNTITEITPFLTGNVWEDKPGNYLDGSTKTSDQMPTNPQLCEVAPGEIVVLWVMYYEAYIDFTGGTGKTGLSIENFRSFHKIPENVKVIAVDGNSSTSNGGHDKNFNVKNSATGTYGLAYYSTELNETSNVEGSKTVLPEGYRGATSPMVCWATVDYTLAVDLANTSENFMYDFDGEGSSFYAREFDSRNMQFAETLCEISLGKLTDYQKITNPWYEYENNEEIVVPSLKDETQKPTYSMGMKDQSGLTFAGWTIDGGTAIIEPGTTYKVASGTHTFAAVFEAKDAATTAAPAETTKPSATTTKAPEAKDTTAATPGASDTTAAAPATTTKAPEKVDEKGCGKSAAYLFIVQLVTVIGGAAIFAIGKKK